jgi:pimeloyl-ACP methyl ester carboxylesterase
MIIHTVPGVAADPRIFSKLHLSGHQLVHHELPPMQQAAAIADYAKALAKHIGSDEHVLLGMSMGGMIVQELAALTKPRSVIIISSWKGPHEMPGALKALRGTHPQKVVTPKFLERVKPLLYWQLGAMNDEDRSLIDSFLILMPIEQIKHQLDASLNWNGPFSPVSPLIHIHGDNDHLMPIAHIKEPIVIRDGGHLMIFNKAEEISAIIQQHLDSL